MSPRVGRRTATIAAATSSTETASPSVWNGSGWSMRPGTPAEAAQTSAHSAAVDDLGRCVDADAMKRAMTRLVSVAAEFLPGDVLG